MSDNIEFTARARETDRALARIDGRIDWLSYLTPTNLDAVAEGFRDSGYKVLTELEDPPIPDDLGALRSQLLDLPMRQLGNLDIEALLIEKQRELDRQIELVRLRGRDGFTMASIDLFGDVDAALLAVAEKVLEEVPIRDRPTAQRVDAQAFMAAAREAMDSYRAKDPRFDFEVVEETTPGTHIFTAAGNLHVAFDYTCPRNRVEPLIRHEVGTHTVTRFNGRCQPLSVLECGLADYDALQEGIAVLAEYLAGDMPPSRLRVLAARAVAARMAIDGRPASEIFAKMREEYHLRSETAFDTTVRALRGGGMTKDALYLHGLVDLLAYLAGGGSTEFLFIGKFALKQRALLERLLDDGFLQPPAIVPDEFAAPPAKDPISPIRQMRVEQFYTESTAA